MTNGEPESNELGSKDLLTLLIHRAEALARDSADEERQSEQRIKFFMSIAGGAIGLVGLFLRDDFLKVILLNGDKGIPIIIGTLLVLLFFGLQTLNRLNWRTIFMTKYHDEWLDVMNRYSAISSEMSSHMKKFEDINAKIEQYNWHGLKPRGSPCEFMYLANAILFTGIFLLFGRYICWGVLHVCIGGFFAFISSIFCQYFMCSRLRKKVYPQGFKRESQYLKTEILLWILICLIWLPWGIIW
jgi:hypothetical protein